jgi:hypothetical protein
MKKSVVFLTLLFLPGIFSAFSQREPDTDNKESLKAQKAAFITEKLELTVEESQTFWPLYNEYEDKMDKIIQKKKDCMKKCKGNSSLTEKDYENLSDELVKYEVEEASLRKEYHEKFKKVISASKLFRLYRAENEFKHHLLNQIRGGHSKRP